MLKDYLQTRNITSYKLAELSNVPYTTINELVNGKKKLEDCKIKTIESIASALNLTVERLLSIIRGKHLILSTSWEDNKDKIYYFPIVFNNEHYECDRIHPLMQEDINNIYKAIEKFNNIKKIILFGSSINIRCNNKSDIDLAIELKEEAFSLENKNKISETIQETINYNGDIVWLNNMDQSSRLYKNISKGVVIYE